jgi:hypothetical protein
MVVEMSEFLMMNMKNWNFSFCEHGTTAALLQENSVHFGNTL